MQLITIYGNCLIFIFTLISFKSSANNFKMFLTILQKRYRIFSHDLVSRTSTTADCRLSNIKGYEWGFTDCHGISVRSCSVLLESLSCAIMPRNVFFMAAVRELPVSLSPSAFLAYLLRNILSSPFIFFRCPWGTAFVCQKMHRVNSQIPRWTCCRHIPLGSFLTVSTPRSLPRCTLIHTVNR